MNHKKHDARHNAAEKATVRDHLSEEPTVPQSQKTASQGRFPGETPLTGEDRPLTEAGGKQKGFDADAPAEHAASGHPAMRHPGPSTMPTSANPSNKTNKKRRPSKS